MSSAETGHGRNFTLQQTVPRLNPPHMECTDEPTIDWQGTVRASGAKEPRIRRSAPCQSMVNTAMPFVRQRHVLEAIIAQNLGIVKFTIRGSRYPLQTGKDAQLRGPEQALAQGEPCFWAVGICIIM